ncbi:hypothetical protein FQN54_006035 [Arachnomyces sp. PD_36]|nr:hypothetical protein FQN54_006035 [Arachnomyces sp. PD_36]
MAQAFTPLEGGCNCGSVRYRIVAEPMTVHCCHCTYCQRETGTAFTTHIAIEPENVTLLGEEPVAFKLAAASGLPQERFLCGKCGVNVWSHYGSYGPTLITLKVGTLDHPEFAPPRFHIYTSTKQPWVTLPKDLPEFEGDYDPMKEWPEDKAKRLVPVRAKAEAYRAGLEKADKGS